MKLYCNKIKELYYKHITGGHYDYNSFYLPAARNRMEDYGSPMPNRAFPEILHRGRDITGRSAVCNRLLLRLQRINGISLYYENRLDREHGARNSYFKHNFNYNNRKSM